MLLEMIMRLREGGVNGAENLIARTGKSILGVIQYPATPTIHKCEGPL